MTGRINTLYGGAPIEVVALLERLHETTTDDLRLALINAFERIGTLERDIAVLQMRTAGLA